MLAVERRSKLTEMVVGAGALTTEELAVGLDVSIETIRRDLLALDSGGVVSRVHGGAVANRPQPVVESEAAFDVRIAENISAKQRIARAAAALIPDNGITMLDVGTTALLVAREVPRMKEGTVVTTSLRVATELSTRPGFKVLMTGGQLRGDDLNLSGQAAVDFFEGVFFDVALLGSGGVDADAGLTDYYLDETAARKVAIRNARQSFVLADSSKFQRVAPYQVCGFDAVTGVIVDREPPARLQAALQKADAVIIRAD